MRCPISSRLHLFLNQPYQEGSITLTYIDTQLPELGTARNTYLCQEGTLPKVNLIQEAQRWCDNWS